MYFHSGDPLWSMALLQLQTMGPCREASAQDPRGASLKGSGRAAHRSLPAAGMELLRESGAVRPAHQVPLNLQTVLGDLTSVAIYMY